MFQITLLAAFGGLAVAGMLVFSLAVGGGATNTVGAIKIWGPLNAVAFTEALRKVADNDSRLSQVTYEQKDPTTYESELTNALANGLGPDLFLMRQDYVIKDAGKVLPFPFETLPAAQFQRDFIQATSPFVSESGIIGIPLFADPLVLYVNNDVLATAGYSQPPQFWDELLDMAAKLTKKDDSGSIMRSAIALGEYKNVNNAKDIVSTLILQAGGSITARDSSGQLQPTLSGSGEAAVTALRFYTEFADPSKAHYSWNRSRPDAQRAFASGELALYIGFASEEPLIKKANANLNYTLAPLPQIRSKPTALNTARVYALAVSRTGKNPSAAVIAASLLTTADNGKVLSEALGLASARRDVLSQPAEGNHRLFNTQAILAYAWLDPDPEKTAEVFRAMIENTTSGSSLVGEAIQRGDQEMAQILEP